jgi:hypothetical protein
MRVASAGAIQQSLCLLGRQPIAQAHGPWRPRPSQLRRQQPVLGGFYRQLPHRRDPDVDAYSPETARFQGRAPGATVAS